MRQIMLLELSPNFHEELLTGLRAEKVRVWQAFLREHIFEAFDDDVQLQFALVDSALWEKKDGVLLIEEFRRWFPSVPDPQDHGTCHDET